MKKQISLLLFTITALFTMVSCNSSDDYDNGIPADAQYSIVTLLSSSSTGSVFEFQKDNNSTPVTFTAPETSIDIAQIPLKSRMLIAYKLETGSSLEAGGFIHVYAYGSILNGDIKFADPNASANFATGDVTLQTQWLTGDYLNLALTVSYSQTMSLQLVCDKSTLEEEYPTVYLIYKADNQTTAYPHSGYASFNVAELWSNPGVRGFNFVFRDTNGGDKNVMMRK